MKISVILPCYNAGAYLSACLDSLLAQSMRDFEVVFVDDGSRDDSLVLARRYAERDARIHVLSQENQGVSAARNLGLAHARGEWITFVDGDDLLPPDAFETLLSGAAEDVDMVVCPHETFDETGRVRAIWPETRWYRGSAAHKRRAAALRLIEGDSVLNIMCGKLIRREMIERERLRFYLPRIPLSKQRNELDYCSLPSFRKLSLFRKRGYAIPLTEKQIPPFYHHYYFYDKQYNL